MNEQTFKRGSGREKKTFVPDDLVMSASLREDTSFNWLPPELGMVMISRTKKNTDFSTVFESARREGGVLCALCLFFFFFCFAGSADHDATADTWI